MATSYELWITYNSEKSKLRIPVLPEKFEISSGSSNTTVDVAELGEIIIKQARPAYEFSWESFFPVDKFKGMAKKPSAPLKYVDKILKYKDKAKPVHLILTDMNVDTYCTIESFKWWEEAGDVGTIYYSISLKEYREVEVRKVTVKSSVAKVTKKSTTKKTTTRVSNKSTEETTYTVKKGDCLWNIAKKYYGSGSKYTIIYKANKSVIGSNPNLIYPGQVLTIPDA